MNVPTRMTRAELAKAMKSMPEEMVHTGFIVDQLKRISGPGQGPYRSVDTRRRLAISYAKQQLGL